MQFWCWLPRIRLNFIGLCHTPPQDCLHFKYKLQAWGFPNHSHFWPTGYKFRGSYWCWSWNSNTLATSREESTHCKRPWCWEGLGAGGEGDDRGWDGWMASPTQCTWVWVNSGSWWWTGRPGVLHFMGSQRVRHDWVTELPTYHLRQSNSMEQVIEAGKLCIYK